MRVVIAGAGAIGGFIGARLVKAGQDVTLLARGSHLHAMRDRGLHVRSVDGDFDVRPHVTDDPASIAPPDVVFLTVKAHSLTDLVPCLRPILRSDTLVVSAQNGIPWWYFQHHPGECEGLRLDAIDPGGVIANSIPYEQVVGALTYFANAVPEPGVIEHAQGNRISLGEPDGSPSQRGQYLADALDAAGFRASVTNQIRQEIWIKLLGNASLNPISALTRATVVEIIRDPDVGLLVRRIMEETAAVASRLGIEIPISIERRMAGAERMGAHKTSMLQDLEAGRPLELDAIVGAVLELGERLGVSMPTTRAVYACAKLLDRRTAAAQPAGVSAVHELLGRKS